MKQWLTKGILISLTAVLAVSMAACGESNGSDPPQVAGSAVGDSRTAAQLLKSITPETAQAKGFCGADLVWYYQDSVLVIEGSGRMTDFQTIGKSNDYDINHIPWWEFKDTIHRVIVKEGCTSIGKGAFYSCTALSNVTIPSSVKEICYGAFYECSSLTSVTIPEGVTTIGYGAFADCSSLTDVTIPNSVTEIDESAFWGAGYQPDEEQYSSIGI